MRGDLRVEVKAYFWKQNLGVTIWLRLLFGNHVKIVNITLVMVQYNCFSPLLNINHGFE